jgi:glycosyltransferase involved in cell wall biosynthesis
MKIALVSSIFIPSLGYLEEGLARVLSGLGHTVSVFTSLHYPVNYKSEKIPLKSGEIIRFPDSEKSIRIIRLRTLIRVRSNIISLNLVRSIKTFKPDLIILVGVSDFFPVSLLSGRIASEFRVIAFIGQNYSMSHWDRTNPFHKKIVSFLINYVIKGFLFRKSVRHLSKIIFYTSDTEEIIKKFLGPSLIARLISKKIRLPLGFNSDDFFFSADNRMRVRRELGIPGDKVVLITATRIDGSKRICEIINSLFLVRKINVAYLLIGFIDNPYKSEIEKLINDNNLQEDIFCLPFLKNELLNKYFSAADYGIWFHPGASIQQGMGTGLPVFLPGYVPQSELIKEGTNGNILDEDSTNTISSVISTYGFCEEDRKKIETHNRREFSYQSLLKRII